MIKKHLKLLILTSVVILLPIVAGVALWNRLPDLLPIHWNTAGEVDKYYAKPIVVFVMPLALLALHWVAALITANDPKRQNQSEKTRQLVFWIVPALGVFLSAVIYATALGTGIKVEMVLPVFFGILFIVMGYYLPKCRQSYTIGIKLPWTLASEENWNKTHLLAGRVWVVGGVLFLIAGFLSFIWFLPIVAVFMVLIPLIYSFILHRKGV